MQIYMYRLLIEVRFALGLCFLIFRGRLIGVFRHVLSTTVR